MQVIHTRSVLLHKGCILTDDNNRYELSNPQAALDRAHRNVVLFVHLRLVCKRVETIATMNIFFLKPH